VAAAVVAQVLSVETYQDPELLQDLEVLEHLHQLQVHPYIMLEVEVEE
jgi:hypothetical protein